MVVVSETDIVRAFAADRLLRGRELHARKLVIDIDEGGDGGVITGRVRGSEKRPYRQVVTVRSGENGAVIQGRCSCPDHLNCKHAAAVLLETLERHRFSAGSLIHANSGQARGSVQNPQPARTVIAPLLTQHLTSWLDEIGTAGSALDGNAYPSDIKHRIIYVVEAEARRAAVLPMSVILKKDGRFGAGARGYTPNNIYNHQAAKHLRPIDFEIMRDLAWLSRNAASDRIPLRADAMSARLFSKILSTGRCRFGALDGPELREGPPFSAEVVWRRQPNGRQRFGFDAAPSADGEPPTASPDAVLPLAPPYYIDSAAGLAGPIACNLPDTVAAMLAAAPDVNPGEAAVFSGALQERLGSIGLAERIPLPAAPAKTETRRVKPVPLLELFVAPARLRNSWYVRDERHRGTFQFPLARLSFDYGGDIVPIHDAGEMLERFDGERLVLTPRQRKAEAAALKRLGKAGVKPVAGFPLDVPASHAMDFFLTGGGQAHSRDFIETFDDPARFLAFSVETVPDLLREGWQVGYSDDYPYRIAEGETGFWADIEGSGIDWFSFELGVEFEGNRINLIPHLTELLSRLPKELASLAVSPHAADENKFTAACATLSLYHTLPDGRLLFLPGARLTPMLRSLLQLIGPRGDRVAGGKFKLHRAEAASLAAFADGAGTEVAWAANAERLTALGRDLRRGRSRTEIAPPASFKAGLRPYQLDGLAWLDFLRETGFGGVLADDMGLGKTVQALAFLSLEKAEGRLDKPALIIAPTSVLPNWQAEAARFCPDLSMLSLRGSERKHQFGEIGKHDVVLTTYPLLARDYEVLLGTEFHAAILDEAQAIKNPKSAISGLAHRIDARHRFALTGTPLENNLGEVWSLFQFLSPGLLGDEAAFRRTFRMPIEKQGDAAAQAFLSQRLKPFMLRRTKQEVAKELPPKTEIVEHVRLEGPQRDLYETVRSLMHAKVRGEIEKHGLAKSHIIFLDALLKLRQVCCDPRLLKMAQAQKIKRSAKLDRLMEMIPEMVGEGRRILLFSQFTAMLALIQGELDKLKIPFVTLTGDTQDRAAPVKAFQSGAVPLFLLSLKAGGTGLNLTAADTVIHYDPWWNPAVENQATDRAYRIGQDKPVFVYKLIVEEGIETAIEVLKARKAALAEALFAGVSKTGLDLTEADISALFAPLDPVPLRRAA